MQPHTDDGGTVGAYATQPHSDDDDVYASGSSMMPPGGFPLLDGKYLAQQLKYRTPTDTIYET